MARATDQRPGQRRLFRQHDVAPVTASALLGRLTREWVELNASAHSSIALEAWAEQCEALEGLSTLGELVDLLDRAGREAADTVLRLLLGRLAEGDQLAGRVLLQVMLPNISSLCRTCPTPRGSGGYEDVLQNAVSEFWSVIAQHGDLERPGVAGRLHLDTLNRLTRFRRSADVWEEHSFNAEPAELVETSHSPASAGVPRPAGMSPLQAGEVLQELDAEAGLLELLMWARRTQVLTAADSQFMAEVFLSEDRDQKATAARLGLSHASVRQRVTRLRTRLVEAVVQDADGGRAALLAG